MVNKVERKVPQIRIMSPSGAFAFQYLPAQKAIGMSIFHRLTIGPIEQIGHVGNFTFENHEQFKLFVDGINDFQRQYMEYQMPEPANDNNPNPSTGEPVPMALTG